TTARDNVLPTTPKARFWARAVIWVGILNAGAVLAGSLGTILYDYLHDKARDVPPDPPPPPLTSEQLEQIAQAWHGLPDASYWNAAADYFDVQQSSITTQIRFCQDTMELNPKTDPGWTSNGQDACVNALVAAYHVNSKPTDILRAAPLQTY